MKNHYLLPLALLLEALIIIVIALAIPYGFPWYAVGYNLIFGLVLCTTIPLVCVYRHGENLTSLGIKRPGARQIMVLLVFVGVSIGGQAAQIAGNGQSVRFDLLPLAILPLIMTTFFEEFLFRGFMQTRFEKAYGVIPAIILSGLFFSLYHAGYPGFRNIGDLALLFAVGLFFALAFKLSGNNLFVAYFVNLPNAFLTYMLKWERFPALGTATANLAAGVTIVLVAVIFVVYLRTRGQRPLDPNPPTVG